MPEVGEQRGAYERRGTNFDNFKGHTPSRPFQGWCYLCGESHSVEECPRYEKALLDGPCRCRRCLRRKRGRS